ncbi:MAG TPA: DUF2852 domain-containing protein [Stellaceae bacterium]|nr:DUF2852 domain-containing protein [Stellaceae bacterium]
MTSAAHDESSYGNPRWRQSARGPWGCWGGGWGRWGGADPGWNGRDGSAMGPQPWGFHPFWGPYFIAKPLLIVLTILGFIWWWPIGLAFLAVTLCRRRMFYGYRRWGGWQNAPSGPAGGWKNWFGGAPPSSGNRAFDEYRAETLRRLEEEQKEFADFLERLRFAKDKAEFDQFMNERRDRPSPPKPSPEPSA